MSSRSDLPRPETLLRCAADLRLRWHEDGRIEIDVGDRSAWNGEPETLDILGIFVRPTTFAEGLKRLAARSASGTDWAGRAEIVRGLIGSGVLVENSGSPARIKAGEQHFGGAPVHVRMLNDRVRTSRLIAAISAEVRPGDVVVEIGTGTGVLAVAAARAGASRVYAIEAGPLAAVAREFVRANGVADRVTIVEGWSQAATLPERGDVFVSETIGNAGFDENLVEIARDAVARLLKPGARMIPRRLRLRALPVEAPVEWLARQIFHPEAAGRWAEWYGMEFAVLTGLPLAGLPRGVMPVGDERARILGPALDLAEAEFFPVWRTVMSGSPAVEIEETGEWNALRLFFEAELAPGIGLVTDPRTSTEDKAEHWGNPLWLVPARRVEPGQRWTVDFAWDARGQHALSVRAAEATG